MIPGSDVLELKDMPEPITYRLEVAPALEPFLPEIRYTLDIMDRYYPVARQDDGPTNRILRYGLKEEHGAISVPSHCFGKGITIELDGRPALSPAAIETYLSENAGVLPPKEHLGNIGAAVDYDAIGLAFIMLSRIEEWNPAHRDRYERFAYDRAFAVRAGRHTEPIADQALEDIARQLVSAQRPTVLSRYHVSPTHDVDSLRAYHRVTDPLRYAAGDLIKRANPSSALRRLTDYLPGEPWRSFRHLMTASEKFGLRSQFFFMGPSDNRMDSPYASTMRLLMTKICHTVIERGHGIGFHPGYDTYKDPVVWDRQKKAVADISGQPITVGRQHVLRFASDLTPRIWAEHGMAKDYTLAFPEHPGFRNGSTRPHPAYDPDSRKALSVDLCATAIMDFGLFGGKYNDFSVEDALETSRPIIDAVKYHQGELVILQHTGPALAKAYEFHDRLLELATS